MDYQEFKNNILEILRDFYGDDATVIITDVIKNNATRYDCIHIIFNGSGNRIIPLIYINDFYESFKNGAMSIEGCIGEIIEQRENNKYPQGIGQDVMRLTKWNSVKESVYPILISTEWNGELLSGLVSTTLLDLSVIYAIRFRENNIGHGIVKITKEIFEQYGISEEELHRQAMENMKKDSYRLTYLEDVIKDMLTDEKLSEAMSGIPDDVQLKPGKMYILTNDACFYGAARILDKDFLHRISGGKDFFILPSSTHETIFLLATEDVEQKELDAMVQDVNQKILCMDERLSDHAYYYDAQAGEIRLCK